jgi:hypothetical protein
LYRMELEEINYLYLYLYVVETAVVAITKAKHFRLVLT